MNDVFQAPELFHLNPEFCQQITWRTVSEFATRTNWNFPTFLLHLLPRTLCNKPESNAKNSLKLYYAARRLSAYQSLWQPDSLVTKIPNVSKLFFAPEASCLCVYDLPTYLPTYLIHSLTPWGRLTNSRSAGQEIPRFLWNPKIHYRVHKSQSPDPNLSQIYSIHTFPTYFPITSIDQTFVYISSLPCMQHDASILSSLIWLP
jgi:hypothetical protein